MSGRKPIKVYQYDNNGKFLKVYNSISEVRSEYFSEDIGKRPIFGSKDYNKDYTFLDDNTLIALNRIGRDAVKLLFKIRDSKYIPKRKIKKQEIECYNLEGELLCTFTSIFAASVLTNIPMNRIGSQLSYSNSNYEQHKELTFKYKES